MKKYGLGALTGAILLFFLLSPLQMFAIKGYLVCQYGDEEGDTYQSYMCDGNDSIIENLKKLKQLIAASNKAADNGLASLDAAVENLIEQKELFDQQQDLIDSMLLDLNTGDDNGNESQDFIQACSEYYRAYKQFICVDPQYSDNPNCSG
jgi:hypothetical protein